MRKPCWVTMVLMMVADVGLDSGVSIQGYGLEENLGKSQCFSGPELHREVCHC